MNGYSTLPTELEVYYLYLLCMQRDRQLIKDLLGEIEKFRARNHKEKEERERDEARRIHEASHDKRSGEGGPDAVLPSSDSSGSH